MALIQVGKIYLNFENEKILVALAVYKNGYCDNFFVLKDLVEDQFNEKRSYWMIPDLLNDKGLLGTDTMMYEFLTKGSISSEIIYEPLDYYDANSLHKYLENNKQLEERY